MNILKIQQDLLKALIKGVNVKYSSDFTETNTFITMDGKVGYVIPDNDLLVDFKHLENAQPTMDLDLEDLVRLEYKLIGTDEYRRSGTARKYVSIDDFSEDPEIVYVDTGLLKNFESPILYKRPGDPRSMCVVTEDRFNTGELTVVGMVMPTIIKDETT